MFKRRSLGWQPDSLFGWLITVAIIITALHFIDVQGAIAFDYTNNQAIAPPSISVINASPFIPIDTGTSSVINAINVVHPTTWNLCDHVSK